MKIPKIKINKNTTALWIPAWILALLRILNVLNLVDNLEVETCNVSTSTQDVSINAKLQQVLDAKKWYHDISWPAIILGLSSFLSNIINILQWLWPI